MKLDAEFEKLMREEQVNEGEFDKLVKKLEKNGAEDPKALAAWIGRKKYGNLAFKKKALAGRKSALK